MATPLENREIMLLVITAAGSTGLTPVQLMKSVFLISRSGLPEVPTHFYSFVPYDYGPFNPDVYRDVEALESEGIVVEVHDAGRSWPKYVITPAGLERAEELRSQVGPQFSAYIDKVVVWVKSLTFSALLRAIYAKYPEMRENSVFQV